MPWMPMEEKLFSNERKCYHSFLWGRGENFICLPRRGESSKLKKGGGSMVEG